MIHLQSSLKSALVFKPSPWISVPVALWVWSLILPGCCIEARAAVLGSPGPLTVQIEASKDNSLYEDSTGNLSNGAGKYLFSGKTAVGFIRRALLNFDIAGAVPAGSTITSVSLTLNMSMTIAAEELISLHRVSADWGEGTSHAAGEEGMGTQAAGGDATWLHRFFDTDFWVEPGGDFSELPSASRPVAGLGVYTWGPTSQLVADVQGWLDDPTSNFGWLLMGNEDSNTTAKRFDSREHTNAENRPVLDISYVELDLDAAIDGIVNYLLGLENDPAGLDLNEDGVIDVADAVYASVLRNTNESPVIRSSAIYRSYPGYAIELPIHATDPEGAELTFASEDLPAGATLDAETGLLSWTPAESQLGPAYINFSVSDSDIPPNTSNGILIFQIVPLDECVGPVCDPATGCEFIPKPLDVECGGDEPEIRTAEPEAPCPEGRVLYVGRNDRGFGRIQNRDLIQVVAFAQGGANVTFHVETRCVNDLLPVTIDARMETVDQVLFDSTQVTGLQDRPDGFSHALGLNFQIDYEIDVASLGGKDALLTVSLTDADGVTLTRQLRLTLTLNETEDLLNPNLIVAPGGEIGCAGCHNPVSPLTGLREGIKDPHPWTALSCTDCHGGDDLVNTFNEAHVFPQSGPSYLKDLAYDKLNEVPLDYLRFINPGDFRVAAQGCGAQSSASMGTGCHQSIVDTTPTSVMATYAGHYKLPRFMAGGQGRAPTVAAVDIEDPDYDPATAPEGTVARLTALREPTEADRSEIIAATDIYLAKSCATCHLSDFGTNNGPGKYRSSGCTACHMVYDDDGISESKDPAILGYFPPHPIEHVLTTAIPTEQCAHCHFQGGRIGLSFRGIREGGFSPRNTPDNAVPWGKSIYGHDPNFYFTDEDDTNSVDETPPDLHFDAGMVCADCHIGSDVHGDGYIYASERDQVGIRCEDCHGTVRKAIQEDIFDGYFKNSKGYALKSIRREGSRILLKLKTQDREIDIPQIFSLLETGHNQRMVRAMGVQENGFSHTDKLECYTCHNQWRQTCFGCHVTVNDDLSQLNLTTGDITQGGFTVTRDTFSIDFFALGMNSRGKITPLCSSMSVFMSYQKDHVLQYRDRVRTTADGKVGFGWNPFHHHTVSRSPMDCNSCHPVDSAEDPTNAIQLNQTYGFGNGEVFTPDGDGNTYDLTAFLDAQGELTSSFPHPNTGPVPAEIRERALSIVVVPD